MRVCTLSLYREVSGVRQYTWLKIALHSTGGWIQPLKSPVIILNRSIWLTFTRALMCDVAVTACLTIWRTICVYNSRYCPCLCDCLISEKHQRKCKQRYCFLISLGVQRDLIGIRSHCDIWKVQTTLLYVLDFLWTSSKLWCVVFTIRHTLRLNFQSSGQPLDSNDTRAQQTV